LSHIDLSFGRHLYNKLLKQWFMLRLALNNIFHQHYSDYTSNSSNGIFVNLIVIVSMEYTEVALISTVVLHSLFQFPLSIVLVFWADNLPVWINTSWRLSLQYIRLVDFKIFHRLNYAHNKNNGWRQIKLYLFESHRSLFFCVCFISLDIQCTQTLKQK
jgi:hypothetical protein